MFQGSLALSIILSMSECNVFIEPLINHMSPLYQLLNWDSTAVHIFSEQGICFSVKIVSVSSWKEKNQFVLSTISELWSRSQESRNQLLLVVVGVSKNITDSNSLINMINSHVKYIGVLLSQYCHFMENSCIFVGEISFLGAVVEGHFKQTIFQKILWEYCFNRDFFVWKSYI